MSVVVVAVSGAANPLVGLRFFSSGHWVYNDEQGAAFHVDGASGNVDAEVPMRGQADAGSQVAQGDDGAYVVGKDRTVEFGKSDLRVTGVLPSASEETPIMLEVDGGPYAVYREAGKLVRFGDDAGPVHIGGRLGDPVATGNGTLWLHRVDDGLLCQLAKNSRRPTCPATVPEGHSGVLTVVDDRAAFVDTSSDTLHLVDENGLGEGVDLGVDVPPDARAAARQVDGKVAILNAREHKLHLVDAGPLTKNRQAEATVNVPLSESGDYEGPASTGDAVVLLNRSTNTVETYHRNGTWQRKQLRGKPADRPLTTGEDGRVYADAEDGSHVVVVDHDGEIEEVPVAGARPEGQRPQATERPDRGERPRAQERPADDRPDQPDVPQNQPAANQPEQPEQPEQPDPEPPRRGAPPPRQPEQPPRQEQPDPEPPPVVASPPGAPSGVSATADDRSATVNWQAASSTGGARITGYLITWNGGGSKTVGANARTTRVTGLTNGQGYVFTVAARNSAGTGQRADSQRVTPNGAQVPGKVPWVDAKEEGDAAILVRWQDTPDNGSPITGWQIEWHEMGGGSGSASGSDTVPASARSYTAEWLRGGTNYEFTVRAVNAAGAGEPGYGDAVAACNEPSVLLRQQGDQSYVEAKCFHEDWDGQVSVRMLTSDDPEYAQTETVTLDEQHYRGTVPIEYPSAGHEVYVEPHYLGVSE